MGVKGGEVFHAQEEGIDDQGIKEDGRSASEWPFLPASNVVTVLRNAERRMSRAAPAAKAVTRKRGAMMAVIQKPRPGVPGVDKGGDRVHEGGPGDGDIDEGFCPPGRRNFSFLGAEHGPPGDQVDDDKARDKDGVVKEHGPRSGIEGYVEDAHGHAQIGKNKGQGHDQGPHGQELGEAGDGAEGLEASWMSRGISR